MDLLRLFFLPSLFIFTIKHPVLHWLFEDLTHLERMMMLPFIVLVTAEGFGNGDKCNLLSKLFSTAGLVWGQLFITTLIETVRGIT